MLAADGASSTARDRLRLEFPGSSFRDKWELADVPLDVSLSGDHAHAFLLPHGEFQFMIRVIDPQFESGAAAPLWRVIGNRAGLLERLATGRVAGAPLWTSQFAIAHRIVRAWRSVASISRATPPTSTRRSVRGMNLGIEDAWVFAQLVRRGELSRYDRLRHATDRRVVRQVAIFSRIVTGEPAILRLIRRALPVLVRWGLPTPRMMAIVTGLDHSLGEFAPPAESGKPAEIAPGSEPSAD